MNLKYFFINHPSKSNGKLREAVPDRFHFQPEPKTIPLPAPDEPASRQGNAQREPRSMPPCPAPTRQKEIETHRKNLAIELEKSLAEIELEQEILEDRMQETARYGETLASVKTAFDAFAPETLTENEAIRELEQMQLSLLRASTRFEQYCRSGQLVSGGQTSQRKGPAVPPLMEVLSLSFFQRFMLGLTFLLPLLLVILAAAILIVCGYLAALS